MLTSLLKWFGWFLDRSVRWWRSLSPKQRHVIIQAVLVVIAPRASAYYRLASEEAREQTGI